MILQQKGFSTSVTRELAVVGVPVHMRKESSGSIKYLTAIGTRFLRPDLMVADFDAIIINLQIAWHTANVGHALGAFLEEQLPCFY